MNSEFYSKSFFVIFNESISFWRSRLINSLALCVLFCQITLGRMHFPCLHPWNTVEGRYDASEHYNLSLSFRIRWQLNRISTQDCSWHVPMDSKHRARDSLQIVQSIGYHAKFGWWLSISETATEKFIRAKKSEIFVRTCALRRSELSSYPMASTSVLPSFSELCFVLCIHKYFMFTYDTFQLRKLNHSQSVRNKTMRM